jgi:hypothetical protein
MTALTKVSHTPVISSKSFADFNQKQKGTAMQESKPVTAYSIVN